MLCNPTRPDLQLTNLFVVISGKNKGAGCGGSKFCQGAHCGTIDTLT
jgi:hypothetical protein